MGASKERVDTKALAQKVDRFRLRRWKMLLERELEMHSRRHEQAQCISRDEMALNKLKKTLDDLSSQRDKLQLRMNRNATDGEGEGEGESADRLQEVGAMRSCCARERLTLLQVEDAIDAADAQAEYVALRCAALPHPALTLAQVLAAENRRSQSRAARGG